MLSDAKSLPSTKAHVTAVIPVEDRGRHELLRLAAALGTYLQSDMAKALTTAARDEHIAPAHAWRPLWCDAAHGVVARVEGRQLALGTYSYLVQRGVVPKLAELHAARHVEARGGTALYLAVLEEGRCLGIVGIESR